MSKRATSYLMRRCPSGSEIMYELPMTNNNNNGSHSQTSSNGSYYGISSSSASFYNNNKSPRSQQQLLKEQEFRKRVFLMCLVALVAICWIATRYGKNPIPDEEMDGEDMDMMAAASATMKNKIQAMAMGAGMAGTQKPSPSGEAAAGGAVADAENDNNSIQSTHKKVDCPPDPWAKSTFGGAVNPGYFDPQDAVVAGGASFRFAAITDLDKLSKVVPPEVLPQPPSTLHNISDNNGGNTTMGDANTTTTQQNNQTSETTTAKKQKKSAHPKKPTFRAIIQPGMIHWNRETNRYTVQWDQEEFPYREIRTHLNEGGRGAEYSELTVFDKRLLTVDDRTGAVVELLNSEGEIGTQITTPIARHILTQGNGDSDKGMKWEWATVKDEELYIGGIGKEMQLSNGDVDHEDAMWIAVLGKQGQVRRVDWSQQYNFVRQHVGCQLPGYMAHEAIEWSSHLRKWIFLPRRISFHQYVPDLDERLGSNKVIIVEEDFTSAKVIEIDMPNEQYNANNEEAVGLRGFSSFAFVPNTQDQHVLALRTVEENCVDDNPACVFRTYLSVFELLTGEVLMGEVLLPHPYKFEGVTFVDLFTKPPPSKKGNINEEALSDNAGGTVS